MTAAGARLITRQNSERRQSGKLPVQQATKFEFVIHLRLRNRSARQFHLRCWRGRIRASSNFGILARVIRRVNIIASRRVADSFPGNPKAANAGNGIQLRETKRAAGAFGMQLQYLDTLSAKDFATAFREASKERADAVFVLGFPGALSERALLSQEAVKNRLPAIYPQINYVEAGGLMSYGTSFADLERRAATYVDKILKAPDPPFSRCSNR